MNLSRNYIKNVVNSSEKELNSEASNIDAIVKIDSLLNKIFKKLTFITIKNHEKD